ncbi:MAG: hypothetical protein Sylvanvirus1_44 [Sylvanvirus sp.]|uniref:Uncharacterized protein n=1 Tax=Sylvanvirus sp. TaxID=2487774 RepID=A0A3G5AH39_9VIRU|nr:MAG: hypothetical protein Sylvanvirus1_44 [Sylvanvirus sp.]
MPHRHFYFRKSINPKYDATYEEQDEVDSPHAILQLTQKHHHGELRESQSHKSIFLIQEASQNGERNTILSPPCVSMSMPVLLLKGQTVSRLDLYVELDTVGSAPVLSGLKYFNSLLDKKLYLWINTINTRKCRLMTLKTVHGHYKSGIYRGRIKDIRWYCIEVLDGLELTSKHKGLIQLLSTNECILGAGEIWMDHDSKHVLWNNETGSLYCAMKNNGRLLYLFENLKNGPDAPTSWKTWKATRTSLEQQIECPFLRHVITPSILYASKKGHYTCKFDRTLKQTKLPPITLSQVYELLDRQDIVHSLTPLSLNSINATI